VGAGPSRHVPDEHPGLWVTLNDELEGPHRSSPA